MKTLIVTTQRKLRIATAWLLCFAGTVSAQTYSKTETITYENNTAKWVLGQTKAMTDPSTGVVEFAATYDVANAMLLTRSAFGKLQHTLTYNTGATLSSGLRGTLSTVKDGNNNVTTLSGWKRGIPTSIVYPDSNGQAAEVNDGGWINWVVDETGAKTCYSHDNMGRLSGITYTSETTMGICDTSKWWPTSRTLVAVATSEYGIPAGHWRETITTGNAVKMTYFDGMWRPLLVREYDSNNQAGTERFTRLEYDVRGRLSFKSYPSKSSSPTTGVWTEYEPLGRVTSVTQYTELSPSLQVTTHTYNSGFTTTVTNPRGHATTTSFMTYDQPSTDWPRVISAPESATTAIDRNVFGKPIAITRSGGGVSALTRSYTYNTFQELCRSVEPETGATLYGYDAAGNLTSSAAGLPSTTACGAANSRTVSRTYNTRNRLTALSFPDGNGNQSWTYLADGLPSQVSTSNSGNTVTNAYTYNKRRLLAGESMVPDTLYTTWAIGYGYNNLGQVIAETYPAGVSVGYAVNALGQTGQITVSVPSTGFTKAVASNASYYPNGALKQFTYGNGIVHTMTQNARQLPSRSTDGTNLDLGTSFDPNGNVVAITDYTGGPQSRSMAYDNLDRLTSASSPMFGSASYSYDTLDNLTRVSVTGGNAPRNDYYCYDPVSRRLDFVRVGPVCSGLADPSTKTLGYDVQGNLAYKNSTGYTFDYGNRLRSTGGVTYRYDAQGRRVRQDTSGGQLRYSYYAQDGRLVWQRDDPAAKRINNFYLAGSLVAELSRPTGAGTETMTYLHTDPLGSPIAKTNSVGTVIETSNYEPYGKLANGSNNDRAGYTGHVMDSVSGLTYMQQRYYDPQIGRFLSVDPVTAYDEPVAGFNRYRYANNNPYRFTDPDGRWIEDAVIGVPSLVMGVKSFVGNVREGNVGAAIVDAVGVIADGAAIAAPGVPGGASAAIGIARGIDKAADAASGAAKLSKVQKSKETVEIGGKYTKTTKVEPGRASGQARLEIEVYKNSDGKTIRTRRIAYDSQNRVVNTAPLKGGPEGRPQADKSTQRPKKEEDQ